MLGTQQQQLPERGAFIGSDHAVGTVEGIRGNAAPLGKPVVSHGNHSLSGGGRAMSAVPCSVYKLHTQSVLGAEMISGRIAGWIRCQHNDETRK
ncbi:hypothetical protein ACQUFY_04120 [Robbsia andropogonis]|uniref:hypothetical protein n=1 Tax=Robbsia andropogonis TaxID=28092 RepID=UPI003D22A9E7